MVKAKAWRKLGIVVPPRTTDAWSKSHASVPIARQISGDRYRIYFGSRNAANLTQVAWADVDLSAPSKVLEYSPGPALALGELGAFDDSAVFPAWLTENNKQLWLYYVGWMRGVTVPFYASLGLAMSKDGGRTFERHSRAPILPANDVDPLFTAAGCILESEGRWRMWYSSCSSWSPGKERPTPSYQIKCAESADGIEWSRDGIVVIKPTSAAETVFSRPCVIRENGIYKMWYSFRGDNYRIGYAESGDGINWERLDSQAGIDVSNNSFESEMVCYSYVFSHGSQKYMLYNGNGFGRDGAALAILEE